MVKYRSLEYRNGGDRRIEAEWIKDYAEYIDSEIASTPRSRHVAIEGPDFIVDWRPAAAIVLWLAEHLLAGLANDIAPQIEVVADALRRDAGRLELSSWQQAVMTAVRDQVSKEFDAYTSQLALPTISLHDLRHSACSLMLSGGVPVEVVQMILGHSSPAVTRRVYAHLLRGATAEQVEAATAQLTMQR